MSKSTISGSLGIVHKTLIALPCYRTIVILYAKYIYKAFSVCILFKKYHIIIKIELLLKVNLDKGIYQEYQNVPLNVTDSV